MKAVVMAGGFGTRLRPLTLKRPKPMVPVVNTPIMEHIVKLLARHGFDELVVLLYHQPETISDYFGDGSKWGIKIHYVKPETDLGTAGAVKKTQPFIDDTFMVISADILTDFNLSEAVEFHKRNQAKASLILTRVTNPLSYGIVITDKSGRITSFLEKPTWGEVFSDTINTGIYMFEPSVFDDIPEDENFDFSKNLFPLMLQRHDALYGAILDGYWRDIGNLDEYRKAHLDILHGDVDISIEGIRLDKIGKEIWVGENVSISPSATMHGTIIIGKNSKIGPGADIYNSVIGPNCVISEGASMRSTVLWSGIILGNHARIDGSIIGERTKIGGKSSVEDGSVISDDVIIGAGSTVSPGVKIWPSKVVEDGSLLSTSLIWGDKWSNALFGNYGVTGLANVEVTPEFATKLGVATGSTMKKGQTMCVSSDGHSVTRLINRAFMAGLMSAGVTVHDLGQIPTPVARFAVRSLQDAGGVHTSKSPFDVDFVDIKYYDDFGLDLPSSKEKAIEGAFFREDFNRPSQSDVGKVSFPQRVLEYYQESFLHQINEGIINQAHMKVVIDFGYGMASTLFPPIFGKFGVETASFGAFPDETRLTKSQIQFEESLNKLSSFVKSLGATAGFMLDAGAEKVFMVDGKGRIIEGNNAVSIMAYLTAANKKGAKIAVPISSTTSVEEIADKFGAELIYTKTSSRSMMEVAKDKNVDLVAEPRAGYIFPQFAPFFDGMFAISKVLEMLAQCEMKLEDVHDLVPKRIVSTGVVACPFENKGRVLRKLIENSDPTKTILIDGVKVIENSSVVFILPDRDRPIFHVSCEAPTYEEADRLRNKFLEIIEEYQR